MFSLQLWNLMCFVFNILLIFLYYTRMIVSEKNWLLLFLKYFVSLIHTKDNSLLRLLLSQQYFMELDIIP